MTDAIITQKQFFDSLKYLQISVNALSTLTNFVPDDDELNDILIVLANKVSDNFDSHMKKSLPLLKFLPEDDCEEGEG